MSNLEVHEQVETEETEGGRPRRDVSSAKRNKGQMIHHVVQDDLPRGSINEDFFL